MTAQVLTRRLALAAVGALLFGGLLRAYVMLAVFLATELAPRAVLHQIAIEGGALLALGSVALPLPTLALSLIWPSPSSGYRYISISRTGRSLTIVVCGLGVFLSDPHPKLGLAILHELRSAIIAAVNDADQSGARVTLLTHIGDDERAAAFLHNYRFVLQPQRAFQRLEGWVQDWSGCLVRPIVASLTRGRSRYGDYRRWTYDPHAP